jgi:hypothetical protein
VSETFDVVRIYDPAIRLAGPGATNITKYATSRDGAELVLVPGREATVFRCVRLKRSKMLLVDEAEVDAVARDRAFAYGCVEIRVPGRDPITPAGDFWTAEELEELDYPDIQEVGMVVLARSRVPFDFAVRYPVLPTSLAVLRSAVSRSAAPSPGDASPKPSAPAEASGSRAPSTGGPAPASGSRTGATAPAPSRARGRPKSA